MMDKLEKVVNNMGPSLKIFTPIMTILLAAISTLILGSLNEIKTESKSLVQEFREYQRLTEHRISRLEFSLYGDGTEYNKGYIQRKDL